MFAPNKTEIADMLKNMLFSGFVAIVLNIAFDLLRFTTGSVVYSLIFGFVNIGAGIIITNGLVKSITYDREELRP